MELGKKKLVQLCSEMNYSRLLIYFSFDGVKSGNWEKEAFNK